MGLWSAAPNKVFEQCSHLLSLIRAFAFCSLFNLMYIQAWSGRQKLWSDCADVLIGLRWTLTRLLVARLKKTKQSGNQYTLFLAKSSQHGKKIFMSFTVKKRADGSFKHAQHLTILYAYNNAINSHWSDKEKWYWSDRAEIKCHKGRLWQGDTTGL